MGVFEFSNFAKGTIGVCESIAKLEDATTIMVVVTLPQQQFH